MHIGETHERNTYPEIRAHDYFFFLLRRREDHLVFYLFIHVIPDEIFHLMTNENGFSDIVCGSSSVEKYGKMYFQCETVSGRRLQSNKCSPMTE